MNLLANSFLYIKQLRRNSFIHLEFVYLVFTAF